MNGSGIGAGGETARDGGGSGAAGAASLPGLGVIHHVGVAVADLDAAIATYREALGIEPHLRRVLADQGVEAAALDLPGGSAVELVAPHGESPAMRRFLERRGEGLHHVAYAVDDVAAALQELRGRGVRLLDEQPRPGLHGVPIAFVHPRGLHGVLTELVEVRRPPGDG